MRDRLEGERAVRVCMYVSDEHGHQQEDKHLSVLNCFLTALHGQDLNHAARDRGG